MVLAIHIQKTEKKKKNPNLNVTTLHKNQLKMDQRAKRKT